MFSSSLLDCLKIFPSKKTDTCKMWLWSLCRKACWFWRKSKWWETFIFHPYLFSGFPTQVWKKGDCYRNPFLQAFPSVRNLSHMLSGIKASTQFPLPPSCPSSAKGIICSATMISRQTSSLYFSSSSKETVTCMHPWSDSEWKMGYG